MLGLDPYDWQINTYEDINDYRRTAVVAANGSGKTVSLVGPVVLWWLYCFPPRTCCSYVWFLAAVKNPALACNPCLPVSSGIPGLEMEPDGNFDSGRRLYLYIFYQ